MKHVSSVFNCLQRFGYAHVILTIKNENMTAKKYLEKIDCFNTIYLNREKESNTMAKIMESYAKKYHERKLKLLGIADVSNCKCKNLPKGEIAISSKALTDPNWKS